jgi:hypothetical protein
MSKAVEWFYVITYRTQRTKLESEAHGHRSGVIKSSSQQTAQEFLEQVFDHIEFPKNAVMVSYHRELNRP